MVWTTIFTLLQAPLARGGPLMRPIKLAADERNISLTWGLPNDGYLDSFHSSRGPWPSSQHLPSKQLLQTVYALRLAKTEALLRARKGFLELLAPGDRHAPYAPVPQEVKDVFLNGEHKILQIAHLVRQLELDGVVRSAQERVANRREVFITLSTMAIALSQMDRLVRFLDREIFVDNASYQKMLKKLAIRHGKIGYWSGLTDKNYGKAHGMLKKKLRKQLKLPELIESILAQRSFLLNRYPLLGVKLEDEACELYQCLYQKLAKKLDLPDLNGRMSSQHIDFNQIKEVDLSQTYKGQAEQNLLLLSQHREQALREVTPLFDQGIYVALQGNFLFLKNLNSQVYFWDNPEPYFIMALDERNWRSLSEDNHFFWINSQVFEQGKRELLAMVEARGERQKLIAQTLEYISWGLMGVGAVAWLSGWGGPALMVLSRSVARIAFLASGVSYGLKSGLNYINSRRYEQLSRQLYVADVNQDYYEVQRSYYLVSAQNYQEIAYVVGSLVLFGRDIIFKSLASLFRPMRVVGEKSLALTQETRKFLRTRLVVAKDSVWMKFAYYRRLLGRSSKALQPQRTQSGLARLLERNAAGMATSSEGIRATIRNNPLIKKALDKVFGRFIGVRNSIRASSFIKREVMVEFLACIASEVVVRGDKFLAEFPHVVFNMVWALGITFKISSQTHANVIKRMERGAGSPSVQPGNNLSSQLRAHSKNWKKKAPPIWGVAGQPLELKTVLRNWAKNSWQLGTSVAWVSALMSGTLLLAPLVRGEEVTSTDVVKAMETFFWMTSLVAITSPPRSQWVASRINTRIDNLYYRRYSYLGGNKWIKMAEDVKIPISIGNNSIGLMSLAYILRERGIQSDQRVYGNDVIYIYNESNRQNANYLFPIILSEEPAGEALTEHS